jgi:two-component system, LytTR family, sensor kinase
MPEFARLNVRSAFSVSISASEGNAPIAADRSRNDPCDHSRRCGNTLLHENGPLDLKPAFKQIWWELSFGADSAADSAHKVISTAVRISTKRPGWLVLGSGRRVSHNGLFWILQLGGWLGFGVMMLGYGLAVLSPRWAIRGAAALVVCGFALTACYRLLLHTMCRRAAPAAALIGVCVILVAVGPPAWFLLQRWILSALGGYEVLQGPYLLWPGFLLEMYLYYTFIITTWILLYFGINGWISLALERRRAEQAHSTAQTARLVALQSHLAPHFLFNTLNSVSSLIVEGLSDQACAMIAKLGEFLRASLRLGETPEIALKDELALLRYYLDTQQVRFGDRLRFSFDIQPQVLNAAVPTLLLQPLVENAVRHGILPRSRGGSLTVGARGVDRTLHLEVVDDGVGMKRSSSSGMGFSNTATRLSELYGAEAELRVYASDSGGVVAAVRLPWRPISGTGNTRQPNESAE